MYLQLRENTGALLCEIDIYTKKTDNIKNDKYYVYMSTWFNMKNYSDLLIHANHLDQKRIAEDFYEIQQYSKQLFEYTGGYPENDVYELRDPKLAKQKNEVIKITRDRLQKIAKKYNLQINED